MIDEPQISLIRGGWPFNKRLGHYGAVALFPIVWSRCRVCNVLGNTCYVRCPLWGGCISSSLANGDRHCGDRH